MTPVLIVDSVMGRRKLMAKILADQGIATVETPDVETAQAVLERLSPSVIVLDPLTNEIQGYDFYQQLQSSAQTMHIPIIILTNLSKETFQHVFQIQGTSFVSCLRDPIKAKELLTMVQRLI